MKKRVSIKIKGQVQGVCFRYDARRKAQELGLVGFVRNEDDESVFSEVEGEEKKINVYIDWCRQGPELAQVEKVEIKEKENLKNYTLFVIDR